MSFPWSVRVKVVWWFQVDLNVQERFEPCTIDPSQDCKDTDGLILEKVMEINMVQVYRPKEVIKRENREVPILRRVNRNWD